MDTKPKFADRVAKLKEAAQLLNEVADTVMLEVIHMEAAERRFSERKGWNGYRKARDAEAAR
jgi:hypothetical protein